MITSTRNLSTISRVSLSVALAAAILVGLPTPASAQTTTPSAELREIIRQRLEQTLDTTLTNRTIGVVGSVTRVSSSTFTMIDPKGRERTVIINPDTTSFAGTAQIRSMADLAIDSGVAVIGDAPDEVVINARRVIPAARPFLEVRRIALGSVSIFDARNLTIVERGNNQTTTVPITTATRFEDILGNTVPRSAIQVDEAILVVIDQNAAGDTYAKRVRLLVSATADEE